MKCGFKSSLDIFISLMTLVSATMIMYKLCAIWLLNLPFVCMCIIIPFLVVCIDFTGEELHRHVGVDTVITSRSLGGVMIITLARNARDVRSILALGTIFSIFITSMILVP